MGASGVEPLRLIAAPIASCGLLVLYKPPGVPTHPTGRYYYNSVLLMLEYVLTPKRLRAWLWEKDPLLQSLVSTAQLSELEKQALQSYYAHAGEEVEADKAPRPCYRLDKATSGILLLGVHRMATAHVATVLMEKSKSVDRAVQSALRAPAGGLSDTACLYDFARVLVQTHFGIRKRYLAKVHGNFPAVLQCLRACAPTMRGRICGTFSRAGGADRRTDGGPHAALPRGLAVRHAAARHSSGRRWDVPRRCPDRVSRRGRRFPSNKTNRRCPTITNAVTIIQCLAVSGEEGQEESLLVCMPLTGRQNQIRLHCRDWLCPILQDPLRFKPSALFPDIDGVPSTSCGCNGGA
ncbi:hypothetical protein STCU_10668 [Strigomonas culicis]|uniref:Pseudouridine synthase RsuA/RluA-like domain-containing protein n=1 Tax=Strigomonas culicis TaxID=28005 RepID=S9V3C6_9TRYP|nr:hypothetical protein STCU_10668 [Strigomonas culicis]|eukprot:EPY17350.1 hypothetical protein STCU_10668 [Strigomonas culicis]